MPVTRATSRAQEWATASSQSPQSKNRRMSSNSSLLIEEDADSVTEYKTATDESLTELIHDAENANNQDRYESTQSELVKLRTEIAELTKIVQQLVLDKNSPPHDININSATSLPTAVHSVSCAAGDMQATSTHAVESTTSQSISEVEIEQRIDQLWNNEPKTNDATITTQEFGTPVLFNGRDHPLSNCYEHSWCSSDCKIDFKGKSFKTAENAWAWLYLSQHGKTSEALTAAQSDPFAAKSMCKKVAASAKWNTDQIKHMTALQNAKFECCDGFRGYLIESNGALVENTRDPFWGGIPMYKGENNLGQILMDKRAHVNKISSRIFISNARAAPQTECTEGTKQHIVMKKCHKCGESNHSTTSCRHGFRIRCNICSREGHKAKMCTNTRLTYTHSREDSRLTAHTNYHASAPQEGRLNNNRSSWQPAVRNGNGIQDTSIQQVHNRNQKTWDQTMSVPQNYNTQNGQEHQRFNHANFHDTSKVWPSVKRQPPPYPIGESYNMYSMLQTTPEATIDAPHQYPNGSGARYNMA